MAAINALFPPKPPRPPPRTLADGLPEGISDPGVPPPPLKLPEPTVLVKERAPDELVPAFARTWRVNLNDLPNLAWVVGRLVARCPHLNEAAAQGLLRGYMMDATCFFQMSDKSIAVARLVRDSFLPLHVEVNFILHNDHGPEGGHIKGSQGEKDAIYLLRLIREWARHQRAMSVTRISDVSDLPPGVLVKDGGCERRDEVWLPL